MVITGKRLRRVRIIHTQNKKLIDTAISNVAINLVGIMSFSFTVEVLMVSLLSSLTSVGAKFSLQNLDTARDVPDAGIDSNSPLHNCTLSTECEQRIFFHSGLAILLCRERGVSLRQTSDLEGGILSLPLAKVVTKAHAVEVHVCKID
jgi:hypothetical protein